MSSRHAACPSSVSSYLQVFTTDSAARHSGSGTLPRTSMTLASCWHPEPALVFSTMCLKKVGLYSVGVSRLRGFDTGAAGALLWTAVQKSTVSTLSARYRTWQVFSAFLCHEPGIRISDAGSFVRLGSTSSLWCAHSAARRLAIFSQSVASSSVFSSQ